MTKEEFNVLSEFEDNFIKAVKAGYIRAVKTSDILKIEEIGQRNNIGIISNKSCGKCVLNYFKQIGKLYFDFKEAEEKKQAEIKNSTEQAEKPAVSKTIKKTTKVSQTKKKASLNK